MLCLSGFELYSRWVALVYLPAQNYSYLPRLQNSPYFCVFKYAKTVKQKVWNVAENRERDGGETLRAWEARALRYALPISLLILRKKPSVLQSTTYLAFRIKLSFSVVTCFS